MSFILFFGLNFHNQRLVSNSKRFRFSSKMGAVEPRSGDVTGGCEPASEQAKSRGLDEGSSLKEGIRGCLGLEGSVAGTHHNGVRVASNGESDDATGSGSAHSEVKTTRVVQTNVSVGKGHDEDRDMDSYGYGLGDSDMKGVSSLLKMRGSLWQRNNPHGGEYEKGDKFDLSFNCSKTETNIATSGHDMQDMSGSRRDVLRRDVVQENDDSQIENGKSLQGKLEGTSHISMTTTENKDGEVGDESYEGCNFFVGDFVWGKIKSHPWWPGRIYDPADASEYASKLKTKNRRLVVYFGDGTFAWCHPSQLKPFEDNFEEMAKQSNSKAFLNAVHTAVSEFGRVLESKMSYVLTKASQNGTGQPLAQNSGIKEGVSVPKSGTCKLTTTMLEPAELFSRVREIAEVIAITNVLELEIIKCHLSALYFSRRGYSLPVYHEPKPVVGLEDTSDNATKATADHALQLQIQGPCEEHGTLKFDGTNRIIRKCPGLLDDPRHPRRKQKSIAEIMGEGEIIGPKRKSNQLEQGVDMRTLLPSGEKTGNHNEESSDSREEVKSDLGADQTAGIGDSGSENGIDQDSLSMTKKRRLKIDSEVSAGEPLLSSEGGHNNFSVQSKDKIKKEALSRERKKSRYLSPPFTNINRTQRKKNIETGTQEASNEVHKSELMSTDLSHLSTTPSIVSCNEVPQEVAELVPGCKLVNKSTLQIPEQDCIQVIDPTNINVSSVNQVLSEIFSAAVNTEYAQGLGFLGKTGHFLYTFRSSIYRNGSLHKVYRKSRPGRKRKNAESAIGSPHKEKNQIGENQSNVEPEKKRIKKANPDSQKQKPPSTVKPSVMGIDKETPPSALFITFGPGSSLPSKDDLINIYCKFGALNETETDMFYNNFCARVTFMKSTDADEALKQSLTSSPFGISKVNFHVQHPSSASKIIERRDKLKSKSSLLETENMAPKMSDLGTPISQSSQLLSIRQNLLMMNSMVQTSEDEVSPTMKTRLENEIEVLLEKVNAMVESSSASKT